MAHNERIEGNPKRVKFMSRETFSLLFFSLLAVVGVSASYQWMETHRTLDAQQAWRQVRPVIQQLSQTENTRLRLAQMTSPTAENSNWDFEFHTPLRQKIHVWVAANGTAWASQ